MTESTELIVREADPGDLLAILRLLAEDALPPVPPPSAPSDRQRAALAELLADPAQQVLVGELDGEIVATCQVSWLRHLLRDGGLVCQVESVRVAADRRGRGLGERLMRHVLDDARRRDCVRVQLTTNAGRAHAHRFYERLGFRASHVGMKLYFEEAP